MLHDPQFERIEPAVAAERRKRRPGDTTAKARHALQPLRAYVRMLLEPVHRRLVWITVLIENRAHELIFELEVELQVAQQPADVGTLRCIAGAHVGIDGRAAVMAVTSVQPISDSRTFWQLDGSAPALASTAAAAAAAAAAAGRASSATASRASTANGA